MCVCEILVSPFLTSSCNLKCRKKPRASKESCLLISWWMAVESKARTAVPDMNLEVPALLTSGL